MNPLLSLDSSFTESDVFYVERSSEEGGPARNNTPAVLNSKKLFWGNGKGDNYYLLRRLAGATDRHNRFFGLQWTHKSIWVLENS